MSYEDQDNKKPPKTKTDPERGGSGKPPKKTAVGLGGNDFDRLRPGHSVVCEIVKSVGGGYDVNVVPFNIPAFLATHRKYQVGETVIVRVVSVEQDKVLLADFTRQADGVPTTRFRTQRAIDLIMPPVDQDSLKTIRIGDYDVEWLITDLEAGMRTGCVKASCESRLSRAAMLLYKGRAVGCIYGCKSNPATKPTEESLHLMLSELESPDTMVTLYDLPENIILAMSSLFLGYPVERHDDYNAPEYLDYTCDWLGKKHGTATLAISLSGNRGTCLSYIYKGEFSGTFYVEDQAYRADKAYIDSILTNDPQAGLEVSILPPEMLSSAVRFGFHLGMARSSNME